MNLRPYKRVVPQEWSVAEVTTMCFFSVREAANYCKSVKKMQIQKHNSYTAYMSDKNKD